MGTLDWLFLTIIILGVTFLVCASYIYVTQLKLGMYDDHFKNGKGLESAIQILDSRVKSLENSNLPTGSNNPDKWCF